MLTRFIINLELWLWGTWNVCNALQSLTSRSHISIVLKRRLATTGRGSPPEAVNSENYYLNQENDEKCIINGHYAQGSPLRIALPIELFHPVFAKFKTKRTDDTTPLPPDFLRHVAKFTNEVSQISTEESERACRTRNSLRAILNHSVVKFVNLNGTSADHIIANTNLPRFANDAALAIIEEEVELGTGLDLSVRCAFSYNEHWCSVDREKLMLACFCPTFLIALGGSWINISGAIYTIAPIVEDFTGYVSLASSAPSNDSAKITEVARILWALREALHELNKWYEQLPVPDNEYQRYFPLATSCKLQDGEMLSWTYEGPLNHQEGRAEDLSCPIFLATDTSDANRKLVIKFVDAYGKDAHELLAAHNLAPKLIYYGDVWPAQAASGRLKMVVMEYIKGVRLSKLCADGAAVPRPVYDDVQQALKLLHDAGMVHGDIRHPNIIVADVIPTGNVEAEDQAEGEGYVEVEGQGEGEVDDMRARTRIIDFDWAGKLGEVQYQLNLSGMITWAEGVDDWELIKLEHDIFMLGMLKKKSRNW